MKCRLLTVAIVALLATGAATAGSAELSFNDNSFDAWLMFGSGKDEDAQFQFGGRYLYSDSDEDDASLPAVVAGFASQPASNKEMRFFLGAQAFLGKAQEQDIEGVGVGGDLTWTPESWKGVFVGARLYYAPSVFCFGDTDSVFEWAGRAGYEINPKIRAFLEYSKLSADLDSSQTVGQVDIEDGLTIGIGVRF